MTKLYHAAAGWQIPGAQDKAAAKVEVPTSPAPLADWLNKRLVPIEPPAGVLEDLLFAGEAAVRTNADGSAERIDLADFYNADEPTADAGAADRRTRCPECKALLIATAAGADKAAISRTVDRIGAWMVEAPAWALDRLADELAERRLA